MNIKRRKGKVKAFTIIEVLVAMVIGSLVISFSYMGYMFILKYYQDFRNKNQEFNDALVLNKTFENDFIMAEKVFRKKNEVYMIGHGKEISYQVFGDALIRQQSGIKDTFRIKILNFLSYFKKEETKQDETLIDKLILEEEILNRKETLVFNKSYASDLLMQETQHP